MIEVEQPGLFSSVQDRGRPGSYGMGIPPSGALDLFAHDVANLLVGNAASAASLEITYVGPTLTFHELTVIAVTGADVDATLDGQPVPPWMSQVVRRGQTLSLGPMRAGIRAYVAVRGGVDVPVLMGSRSTNLTSGLGGHEGRTLQAGDRLPIGYLTAAGSDVRGGVEVPEELRPRYRGEQEIRVVPGLCDYLLAEESISALYDTPYSVSIESNRTGYRFKGQELRFLERTPPPFGAGSDPSNVVNLGYPVGSIQAPSGSELICLLRDAVTGGGYATIGTVISADLDLLAQAKPFDTVRFTPVSIDAALAERAAGRRRLEEIRKLAAA